MYCKGKCRLGVNTMIEKCACVVLNYNDYNTTSKFVNSIRNYTIFDYIVVVDNCSLDNSYEKLIYLCDKKIKCLRTVKNGGYGYGNNFGIAYAYNELGCKYIVLSNPDVSFNDEYVINCINHMKKKELACISGVQLDVNGDPISEPAWKIPSAFEYAVMGTRIEKKYNCNYQKEELDGELSLVECLPGAMLIYDAEKFLDVGGYDESMFLYCEETAIAIRLKNAGYLSALLNNETYKHEHSISINKSIKSCEKQTLLMFDSRNYIMNKYLHAGWGIKMIAAICHKYIILKNRRNN